MLTTSDWSNAIFASCPPSEVGGCVFIPFKIARWLFVGCIIFGFLLVSPASPPPKSVSPHLTINPSLLSHETILQLAYEARKTKKIISSRDISYAFTNVMANYYYSLRESIPFTRVVCSQPSHPGSFDHFCLFCHINDSTNSADNFAFFVFFTFKGLCPTFFLTQN